MGETVISSRPTRRGRPPGARPDPVHRRRQLVTVARMAIARLGPDASMTAIAGAAGYTKPALYAAFKDKASLADALAAEVSGELAQRIGTLVSEETDLPVALRGAIDAFCQFVETEPALFRFLVQGAAGFGRSLGDRQLLVSVGEVVGSMMADGLRGSGAVSRAEWVDQLTMFAGSGLAAFAGPSAQGTGSDPGATGEAHD